jgi:prepilin-type processing-associated H-X9-DG protein
MVISSVVYATLLILIAQWFLQWLYREMGREDGAPPRTWRWRSTLGGFALVMLMFTAGMAAIGVVHQTAWFIFSPVPSFQADRGRETANRVKCASNMRQIGQAILEYTNQHGGKYPDDLATLLLTEDISAGAFVCPSDGGEAAQGDTPQQIVENFKQPGHCSYLYFGKGLTVPVDPNRVVLTEPLVNHEDYINVLFGDGHVEGFSGDEAEQLLAKLGVAPATRPDQ